LTPTAQVPELGELMRSKWSPGVFTSFDSLIGVLDLENMSVRTEDYYLVSCRRLYIVQVKQYLRELGRSLTWWRRLKVDVC